MSTPKQIHAKNHRVPGAQQAVNVNIPVLTLLRPQGTLLHISCPLFSEQRFLHGSVGGVSAELRPMPEMDPALELRGRFEQQKLLSERKGKCSSHISPLGLHGYDRHLHNKVSIYLFFFMF